MLKQPACSKRKCKWFEGVRWLGDDEVSERVVCSAFPNGIPEEIAYGDNKHKTIHPDQKGNATYEREQ